MGLYTYLSSFSWLPFIIQQENFENDKGDDNMNEEELLDILLGNKKAHNDPNESGVFIFDDSDSFISYLNKLMEVRK